MNEKYIDTFIPARINEKELKENAQKYCKRHKLQYGIGSGQISIKTTDARCAPYNYQLVRWLPGGAYSTITGVMRNRDLYLFLKWA